MKKIKFSKIQDNKRGMRCKRMYNPGLENESNVCNSLVQQNQQLNSISNQLINVLTKNLKCIISMKSVGDS